MPGAPQRLGPALARGLLVAALVVAYPLSRLLPSDGGWENSPVENGQVLLLAGAVFAAVFRQRAAGVPGRTRFATDLKAFWLGAALLWLVLAGRELTWGAVFMTPVTVTVDGPYYPSRLLPHKPWIMLLVGLVVAFSVFLFVRHRADRLLRPVLGGRDGP